MVSFRSHVQTREFNESGSEGEGSVMLHNSNYDDNNSKLFPTNETRSGSPEYKKSYGDTQLEIFHHRHGLLVLHLLATLMFGPSLAAWLQVCISSVHLHCLLSSSNPTYPMSLQQS